jgi:hypothetical protein
MLNQPCISKVPLRKNNPSFGGKLMAINALCDDAVMKA